MSMSKRNAVVLPFVAAAAMLAACAPQTQTENSGVLPQRTLPANHMRPPRQSWMAGGVGKQDLLYVSNGNAEVTVYRYWQHTLVGVLTDFTQPMGECVDKGGDVFITDYAAKQIVEYAHGGSNSIKTLNDSPDSPYTCYVDSTTGNLAVANDDGSSQEGNIAIWSGASGSPTTYADSTLYNFQGCAYDNKGNLLVTNGYPGYPYATYFAWLPKNGSKLINIDVPGAEPSWKWYDVEGIQWDGKYFVLDSYDIYRIALLHGQAYYVGETDVGSRDENPSGPYWIYNAKASGQGTQVVGGENGEEYGSEVDYWDYPAGGEYPIEELTHGIDRPFGVTISLKKS